MRKHRHTLGTQRVRPFTKSEGFQEVKTWLISPSGLWIYKSLREFVSLNKDSLNKTGLWVWGYTSCSGLELVRQIHSQGSLLVGGKDCENFHIKLLGFCLWLWGWRQCQWSRNFTIFVIYWCSLLSSVCLSGNHLTLSSYSALSEITLTLLGVLGVVGYSIFKLVKGTEVEGTAAGVPWGRVDGRGHGNT